MTQDKVWELIKRERQRQDKLYGEQKHANHKWFKIMLDEFKELKDILWSHDPDQIKYYVTQVVAVGVAWLERMDG